MSYDEEKSEEIKFRVAFTAMIVGVGVFFGTTHYASIQYAFDRAAREHQELQIDQEHFPAP